MLLPVPLLTTSCLIPLLLKTTCASFSPPSNHHQISQNLHLVLKPDFEQDPATYDDACNIGFCSVMGATIGGWGANYTFVSTQAEFADAVAGTQAGVVIVQGAISGGGQVSIGSDKSIVGAPGSSLSGISLILSETRNVIVRNLKISSDPTNNGEAISIENSRSIWVDHCELSSTARIVVTKGSDYVTITNNLFRGHQDATPAVTVGHPNGSAAEDQGKFHVTFARNYFKDVKSAVSVRFGTSHLFNSYFENVENGINTRMGAELLIEASVFSNKQGVTSRAVFSDDSTGTGFATLKDVVLGNGTSTAPVGAMTEDSLPYPYDWYMYDKETVRSAVTHYAGQSLEFLTWD